MTEDDDGSEDELDLDVSFEEVPTPPLSPPLCFVSLLAAAAWPQSVDTELGIEIAPCALSKDFFPLTMSWGWGHGT